MSKWYQYVSVLAIVVCMVALLEMRPAQKMTLMGECVECGGMDGEETLG